MPGGRPKKIRSVKKMRQLIDEYFKACEGQIVLDKEGHAITDKYNNPVFTGQRPPTVAGLALALGFKSRQTLLNYQDDEAFEDAITEAKSRIEEYVEGRLFDRDGAGGAKFSLINNFAGWKPERMAVLFGEKEESGLIQIAAAPEADRPEEMSEAPDDGGGEP